MATSKSRGRKPARAVNRERNERRMLRERILVDVSKILREPGSAAYNKAHRLRAFVHALVGERELSPQAEQVNSTITWWVTLLGGGIASHYLRNHYDPELFRRDMSGILAAVDWTALGTLDVMEILRFIVRVIDRSVHDSKPSALAERTRFRRLDDIEVAIGLAMRAREARERRQESLAAAAGTAEAA